ncbi:MAG: alpha/beta hydrolase [Bacteroidota bacterium]
MEKVRKRKWKKWAKILITIYILGGIAIYTLQDIAMLRPVKVKRNEKYNFTQPYREINIPLNNESTLNVIQFTTKDSLPRGVVLYLHGNKRNIARYAEYSPYFTKHGYEVWMIDYPGFGKSTGDFTEQNLYECAGQLYKMAHSRFSLTALLFMENHWAQA